MRWFFIFRYFTKISAKTPGTFLCMFKGLGSLRMLRSPMGTHPEGDWKALAVPTNSQPQHQFHALADIIWSSNQNQTQP